MFRWNDSDELQPHLVYYNGRYDGLAHEGDDNIHGNEMRSRKANVLANMDARSDEIHTSPIMGVNEEDVNGEEASMDWIPSTLLPIT